MQLKDKIAIVTGSGIGRAIAHGFSDEDAHVLVSDIDGESAETVAGELAGDAAAVHSDVSDTASVNSMVDDAVNRFGRLDILVNNADRARGGWVANMSDEDWDSVFAVNVRGTFACSHAALKYMMPQQSGRIVNTTSGTGLRAFPRASTYAASKAAIINFTYSLAAEVAKYGITVNAIGPGVTDTPFWRARRTEEDIDAAIARGDVGQPKDFVPMVTFLCSDAGAIHTGQMVNRGIHMPEVQQ